MGAVTIHEEKPWLTSCTLFCRRDKGLYPLDCQLVDHTASIEVCRLCIPTNNFYEPAIVKSYWYQRVINTDTSHNCDPFSGVIHFLCW